MQFVSDVLDKSLSSKIGFLLCTCFGGTLAGRIVLNAAKLLRLTEAHAVLLP